MNIDVMKTYCDLVDTGSFSKAAQMNYISQSAVSQQLAKLEHELGTQLVSRGGGIVAATEAGKTFYEGSRDILARYEQLLGEVRTARDAVRGVLRVGTIYSVGFYLLSPYIRKFMQAQSEVVLHVVYTSWSRIYDELISGEMDVGVAACPEKHRSIEIIPLASQELVLVCPPGHRLAGRERVAVSELQGENFIAFEANIPTRRLIDKQLLAAKVAVNITMEFDNIELLKRAIEVGSGVGILPRDTVEHESARGELSCCRLSGGKWQRPIAIVRRRGKVPSPAERMFLAVLRETAAK